MPTDPAALDPLTVLVPATWPVAELAGLPVWLGDLVIATGRDVAGATALTVGDCGRPPRPGAAPRAGLNASPLRGELAVRAGAGRRRAPR